MYHPAKREMLNAKGKGDDCSSWWGRQGLWGWAGGQYNLVRLREDLYGLSLSLTLKGAVTSRVGKPVARLESPNSGQEPKPSHCLILCDLQAKNGFSFLCGWEISKQYFITLKNYMKFKFQFFYRKFYWNMATLVHLGIVSICFQSPQVVAIETMWSVKLKIFTITCPLHKVYKALL